MFGSVRIAEVSGIRVEVHVTFLLTLFWAAWQGASLYGGLTGAAYGTITILLVFACVLLHELGHGLQARALGIGVQRVTLLPIGGLARLESMHDSPRSELLITLAGPAVNLALAFMLAGILLVLGESALLLTHWRAALAVPGRPSLNGLLLFLLGANVSLFLFNMMPAFPMDGGRILRALMALLIDYETATRIAAMLGSLMAVLLSLAGIFGLPPFVAGSNLVLVLIAIMILAGATQEAAYVRRRKALTDIAVGQAAHRGYALSPSDRITPALARGLFAQHAALPVVVGTRLIGLLTPKELRSKAYLPNPTYVAHVMRTDFPVLSIGQTLWAALEVLRAHKLEAAPVVHDGALHGMLSLDDINRAWRGPRRQHKRLNAASTPQEVNLKTWRVT